MSHSRNMCIYKCVCVCEIWSEKSEEERERVCWLYAQWILSYVQTILTDLHLITILLDLNLVLLRHCLIKIHFQLTLSVYCYCRRAIWNLDTLLVYWSCCCWFFTLNHIPVYLWLVTWRTGESNWIMNECSRADCFYTIPKRINAFMENALLTAIWRSDSTHFLLLLLLRLLVILCLEFFIRTMFQRSRLYAMHPHRLQLSYKLYRLRICVFFPPRKHLTFGDQMLNWRQDYL